MVAAGDDRVGNTGSEDLTDCALAPTRRRSGILRESDFCLLTSHANPAAELPDPGNNLGESRQLTKELGSSSVAEATQWRRVSQNEP